MNKYVSEHDILVSKLDSILAVLQSIERKL
jgi:hypothetical protein